MIVDYIFHNETIQFVAKPILINLKIPKYLGTKLVHYSMPGVLKWQPVAKYGSQTISTMAQCL